MFTCPIPLDIYGIEAKVTQYTEQNHFEPIKLVNTIDKQNTRLVSENGFAPSSELKFSIFSYFDEINNKALDEIKAKIFDKMNFPVEWEKDHIERPNLASKSKTYEVCKALFNEHKLLPSKIAPTIEEGLYLAYENEKNNKSLIIEVYNNLEVAAIITNNKKRLIEYSEDIYGLELIEVVKAFNS